ncbi:hypothetical protein M758_9G010300, partial [Ceratodon purpureus]
GLKRGSEVGTPVCDRSSPIFRIIRESLNDKSWHCLWLSKFPPLTRSSTRRTLSLQRSKKLPSTDKADFDLLLLFNMFPAFNSYAPTCHSLTALSNGKQDVKGYRFKSSSCVYAHSRKPFMPHYQMLHRGR